MAANIITEFNPVSEEVTTNFTPVEKKPISSFTPVAEDDRYSTLEKAVERTDTFKGAGEFLNKVVGAINPFMSDEEHQKLKSEVERVEKGGGGDIPLESNALEDPVFMGIMGGAAGGKLAYKAGERGLKLAGTVAKRAADEALMNTPSLTKMVVRSVTPEIKTLKYLDEIKKIGTVLPDVPAEYIDDAITVTKWQRQVATGKIKVREADKFVADMAPHVTVSMDDQLVRAKEKILNDPEVARTILKKGAWSSDEQVAIGVIAERKFADVAERAVKGEWDAALFKQEQDDVFKDIAIANSEAGRVLNDTKIYNAQRRVAAAWGKLKRGLNDREIQELAELAQNGLLEDPGALSRYARRIGDPTMREYFWDFWYSNILSGIPTHLRNTVSNIMWQAFQIPHRAILAGTDSLLSWVPGRTKQYFWSEVFPSWIDVKSGAKEGARGFVETLKTGQSLKWSSKYDMEIGAPGAFERSPNATVRKISPIFTWPRRLLAGADIFTKSIAFDTHLGELCRRKGIHPENATKAMLQSAKKYSDYVTFTDKPGEIVKILTKIRNAVPGGRFFFPFITTPANLWHRGAEMLPGFGMVVSRKQPAQEIIAKQVEGLVLSAALYNKWKNGEIVGAAPENKTEREMFYKSGKLPFSIKLFGAYRQFRGFEPFNLPMAFAIATFEANENSQDDPSLAVWKVADNIRENLIDSPYMQGLQTLFNQYGKMEGFAQRSAATMVPMSSFWRSINRAIEQLIEGEVKVRDTNSLKGAFSQTLPGAYNMAEPSKDLFGEDQIIPGNVFRQWLPYKWAEEKQSALGKELSRLDLYPGKPSQTINLKGKSVKIPDKLYSEYQEEVGGKLKDTMTRIINSSYYDRLSDEQKEKRLKGAIRKIRKVGLEKLKREYDYRSWEAELK